MHQSNDFAAAFGYALGDGLGAGRVFHALAGGKVDRLQHGVDGASDGRPRAAAPPGLIGVRLLRFFR